MTEADWIILRLTRVVLPFAPRLKSDRHVGDLVNSIVYLNGKYGVEKVLACIDQLTLENP